MTMRAIDIAVIAVILVCAPLAHAETPAAAGMRMHVDPDSGAVGPPPPAATLAPEAALPAPPVSAPPSHPATAPLVPAGETVPAESAKPGGGGSLDVRGRFRSEVRATVEPDGSTTIRCLHADEAPQSGRGAEAPR
jgi:hypothetical protein